MVLLAYIITLNSNARIRILRMAKNSEDPQKSRGEMEELLNNSRLDGEIVIIEHRDCEIYDILKKHSAGADIIMMGLPGNFSKDGLTELFGLNELFFDRQIAKYEDLPPVLFVKSAQHIELTE